jgi:outer membrane protein insertion porin family
MRSYLENFAGAAATRLALCLVLALLVLPAVQAQEKELRLVDVELTGELAPFSPDEISELLRSRPNRRFLGIPGATPSLWLFQAGTERTVLGRALMRAGEPPAFYDPAVVAADRERLQAQYRQDGFLGAIVTADVDTLDRARVRVRFHVAPGPPSEVRTVQYSGLDRLAPPERSRLVRGSVLSLERSDADPAGETVLSARPGQRLSETQLLDERRRLLADLRDMGFAAVSRDSIGVVAFPRESVDDGAPVFDIEIAVVTGPRYAFGDVRFRVTGPENLAMRADTLERGSGVVITTIVDEARLAPRLLHRALRFEPGDTYRQSALLATKRRLDRTGVFTFSEIVALPQEVSTPVVGDTLPMLPHRVVLRTRRRHSIRLEGFVLQRTGVLGAEATALGGDELGLGVGASYANANTFGSGEQFSVGMNASVAGDLTEFPTTQTEVNVGMSLPYLAFPFGPLEGAIRPFDSRTRLSLGFLAARRDELRLLIRGRASAGIRYEVQHSPTLTSFLDLVDFRLSDPDTLSGFRAQFLDLIEDPVARQFVLDDYTQPQVNDAFRYTLLSATADPFRRDRGFAREVSIEAGGYVSSLFDRFVFNPGELDGSLPGLPLFGGGGRLEYRPYLRATADARQYLRVGRLSVIALKGVAGVSHPTGRTPVVPFDRRYYAGGPGSVRGWDLRRLGPGSIPPEASAFVQGGDIRLELGLEARRVVLRELFAADWQLAAFADAGNVWFGPRNPGDPDGRFRLATFPGEIAVGAGGGLRVVWDFLILRFDVAWKVRSPVTGDPLFPDGNTPRLHFGIGQAL